MGFKMRFTTAISTALTGAFLLVAPGAEAQTAPQGPRTAQASQPLIDEPSAQAAIRRPPKRVRIYPRYQAEPDGVYPRYFPGPNALRVCSVAYVQEYRPSGTVIVPRMSCAWRPG
jgi:lipoprotein-anchoring transpeptidase ErfK/SrfK